MAGATNATPDKLIKLALQIIFCGLAVAFVAPTAALYYTDGLKSVDFMALEPSQFIYFPTIGLISLSAWFLPCLVFADLYWTRLPFGKFRLLVTFLIGGIVAYFISLYVNNETSFATVKLDSLRTIKVADCANTTCPEFSLATSLDNLRHVSRHKVDLSALVQDCMEDPFRLIRPLAEQKQKFCFAASNIPSIANNGLENAEPAACCKFQRRASESLRKLSESDRTVSAGGLWLKFTMPFRVFFFGMMILITIHLGLRKKDLVPYAPYMQEVEIRVVVGLVTLAAFIAFGYAQLQTREVLLGRFSEDDDVLLKFTSAAVLGAAGFVGLFFYNMHNREIEKAGKITGIITSGIAYFKFDQIIVLTNKYFGSGISPFALIILLFVSFLFSILIISTPAWRAIRAISIRSLSR